MQLLIITNERTGERAVFKATDEQASVRHVWPEGCAVGYSVEPYKLVAGRLVHARGYTPPIRRHFWPQPSARSPRTAP